MKKGLKNIGLILLTLILLGYGKIHAQTVDIPDPNFRKFLLDSLPNVMDTVTGKLQVVNANSVQGTLNCSGLNIKSLEGIQHFKSIWDIDCSNNQISYIPDLSVYDDWLRTFYCQNNQLTSLPNFRVNATKLVTVNCANNQLRDLPDFSTSNIDTLKCQNNRLTFSDLILIDNTTNMSTFEFSPQNPVVLKPLTELNEGDTYEIQFPEDVGVINSWYELYRNGVLDTTSVNGKVLLTNFNSSMTGKYEWNVTNPAFPGLTIHTTTEELVLKNKNEEVFTPNGDGMQDSYYIPYTNCISKIYDKFGTLIKELPTPAYWDGTDTNGKLVPIGAYILRCGDNETSITLVY